MLRIAGGDPTSPRKRGEVKEDRARGYAVAYFTNSHPPSVIGLNAWSAGIVETSL
ncbi:hypothetical protein ABID62_004717 [Bradyrhizobium sp. S3.9.1]|jgi:hypothetical protein